MKINFDVNKVAGKIQKKLRISQYALDQQVIKDSNYYAPEDKGELQDSAILGSSPGQIRWDKSYARRQYYEDNDKSKDRNPNASMKWFEVAKAKWLKVWLRVANDKYNK